jgi:hypothetical protein
VDVTTVLRGGEEAVAAAMPTPLSGDAAEACEAGEEVTGDSLARSPRRPRATVGLGACLRCCGGADIMQVFVSVERVRDVVGVLFVKIDLFR